MLLFIKLTISILGIIVAIQIANFKFDENFLSLDAKSLCLAFVSLILSYLFSAYRTTVIFNIFNLDLSLKRSVYSYFIGNWFNQFLPSNIGGDVVRAQYLRNDSSFSKSLFLLFVDRMVGFIISILIVAIFFAIFYYFRILLIGFFFAILVCFLCIFFKDSFLKLSSRFIETPRKLDVKKLLQIIVTSAAAHFSNILCYYFLMKSYEASANIYVLFLLIPLISYISLIPISLGGWGVRETSTVLLFKLYAISEVSAFSLSITYGLLVFLAALPGLVFFTLGKRKKPTSSETA